MTRNQMIEALATATTRSDLVAAIKAAGMYKGVSRYNVEKLTRYARELAKGMRAEDEAKQAKPEPKQDDAPRCAITGRRMSARQIANNVIVQGLLDAETPWVTRAAFDAAIGKPGATYWTPSAWVIGNAEKQPAMWNPYFMAAVRLGVRCDWNAAERTVELVALGAESAEQQVQALQGAIAEYKAALAERRANRPEAGQSASRQAARKQAISAKTVQALASAIKEAGADEDGVTVLDGNALALAGVSASWAKTSNAHLADAEHVRARTLAALGYAGRTTRGTLTLTPIADAAEEVAS
jgi:hypothetical protein